MRSLDETSDAPSSDAATSFDRFAVGDGERLRRVLVAHYGVDVGNDVHADALAYAWEHWTRVADLHNPVGYLYRVAQTASRRHRRWRRPLDLPAEPLIHRPATVPVEPADPGLHEALRTLTDPQRICIVLVHVYDWSYADAAAALDVPVSTVRNHLHRGLVRLRSILEP